MAAAGLIAADQFIGVVESRCIKPRGDVVCDGAAGFGEFEESGLHHIIDIVSVVQAATGG